MVTNGNVTLSTASPVTDSQHKLLCALDAEPDEASGADSWGPGGPRALSWIQCRSMSGFHPVCQETVVFPASTSGQQGGPWVGGGGEAWRGCQVDPKGHLQRVVPLPALLCPPIKWGNWTRNYPGSSASRILGIMGNEYARAEGPRQPGGTFWNPAFSLVPVLET